MNDHALASSELETHLAAFRRAGPFVFVAGMGPRDATGTDGAAASDIRAQTAATIQAMHAVLIRAGGGLENLVEVTTYLTNMADFAGYNDMYSEFFSSDGPARTTVAVHRLQYPGQLVEMRGTAYIVASSTETA